MHRTRLTFRRHPIRGYSSRLLGKTWRIWGHEHFFSPLCGEDELSGRFDWLEVPRGYALIDMGRRKLLGIFCCEMRANKEGNRAARRYRKQSGQWAFGRKRQHRPISAR